MTPSRVRELRRALDAVRAREDLRARRAADPVELVHRFAARDDQEIAALVCASCAFGNVKAIRAKLDELFERVGPSPSEAADDPRTLKRRLRGFVHRVYRGEDLAKLIVGARRVQREAGSLGRAFAEELSRADRREEDAQAALREALASFCDRIRDRGGFARTRPLRKGERRGTAHLLSDVRAGGAGKRLVLFLRWMVRPSDGIDLGLWDRDVPPSRLLVPVDVHIHKLALNLGLTRRTDVSWKTAVEITRALAELDASDPVRYDFSLCHLGMVQRCPSRRDPKRCEGCGVRPVCVHWTSERTASEGSRLGSSRRTR
jgi:uncharacterized protein (TIGR02757 family)